METPIQEAVLRLKEIKRLNIDWDFKFCARQVASWNKVDLGTLISAYKKGDKLKTKRKVKCQETKVIKRDKDGWPEGTPYWVKK